MNEENDFRIMEIKLFDNDFYDYILRYAFNVLMAFILLKFIYRSDKKNRNYAFTFYVFNTPDFLSLLFDE